MQWLNVCISLVFVLNSFIVVYCKIPNYVQLCQKNDSKCLLENINRVTQHLAVDGEPMFKISNISKIHVDTISMQATPELQVNLKDLYLIGLGKAEIHHISLTDDNLHFQVYLPRLEFVGTYDFNGKLLILTLKSTGDMNVTEIGVEFDYKAKLFTEERRNKKYYYVRDDSEYTKTNLTKIKSNAFSFGNLFPSDPRISEEMNFFLNDNWRAVYNEVKFALENAYSCYLLNPIINGFLRHIPIDSLFIN